ncbi:protein kinase [Marinicella sediminis]|uniref:Protein kinase n=1 Tax=Marinicella sediminis TaxID=1792834 RepID=A0ABV7J817_9GAMM|nr:serine/threonine-protein kinase [Marinicella sediminis]
MSQEDILEQLADSLADDLVIDWQLATTLDDQSETVIQNLAVLGQIAQLQGQTRVFSDTKPYGQAVDSAFRWGHLHVLESIGSGVYGEVFRAHDDVLDRQVALKLLKTEVKSVVESMRFIEEAKRMARVRHPHVLAIHGADVHQGRSGFWADLIEGQTVDQLDPEQVMSGQALFLMCDQLSAGLAAIHRAGIIHGDIKPANLIRDDQGNYLIMDFGAGERMDEQGHGVSAWQGTPLLMAPEQMLHQQSGPASDIYALGATLFKLATGRYPVPGETLEAIRQGHLSGGISSLQVQRPDMEQPLASLVDDMLLADPDKRPNTAQIQKRLRELEQLPQRRKNRRAVISIITLLVMGMVFSGWGFFRAEQEKAQALVARSQAEAISGFLQDMLNASSELGRGKDITVADMLDIASPEVDQKFADQPQVAAALHHALANSYNALRETGKSLQHAQSSLTIKRGYLDEAAPELLKTRLEQIQGHQLQGDHEQSLVLIDDYLQAAVPVLGDDNRYVQLARKHQINNLFSLSRFEEANAILEQYFAEIEDPATATHNFGFEILQAKANALTFSGDYAGALEMAHQAIEWLSIYPNKSPMNEAGIRTVKALSLLQLGRADEAEKLFQDVLLITERVYGKDNQEYLETLNNLSTAQKALGWNAEALQTNQQAFALAKQIYGDQINLTVIALGGNLANLQVEQGELQAGEATMRETLAMAIEHLGNQHVETLKLEYNLAELLNNQGLHQQAEAMASQTYAMKAEVLGEAHPYTILSMDNWAISLAGQQRFAQALVKHRMVVEGLASALGAAHPYTWLVMKHEIESLQSAGELTLAKQRLSDMLTHQRQTLPVDDLQLQANEQWLLDLQDLPD